MPHKALKPCKHPGCPNLTNGQYCADHRPPKSAKQSYRQREYDTYKWQQFRRRYLMRHQSCVECGQPATTVDHIIPLKKGGDFYEYRNLQALCSSCHSRKTASEDGGFGNKEQLPSVEVASQKEAGGGQLRCGVKEYRSSESEK